MIDTVFISDLHLHPKEYSIQKRFNTFLKWACAHHVKNIYILGDFFHVWAGDDSIDDWSHAIAEQIHALSKLKINVFYMHGNRDFLLGKTFAKLSGWMVLSEPTIITLGGERIMLVHGDRYCTRDTSHQRFRLLTRNKIFLALFLLIPLKYRKKLVDQVRNHSQNNVSKSIVQMDVVEKSVVSHMKKHDVTQLIHGHTHKSGRSTYEINSKKLIRYVLSDWDDNPSFLCYDNTKGLYFTHVI